MRPRAAWPRGLVSPLSTWFPGPEAVERFRRRRLGRTPALLRPRDRAWQDLAPGFAECVAMAGAGLPFQVAAERRYDRSGDPRRLHPALAAGKTVFLPQVHQVLPRLMRLMVALRAGLFGPLREEASFLFLVAGGGRTGMGLHHDGPVDAMWLQLEGRRTVTIGPPVPRDAPEDLDDASIGTGRRGAWRTLDLEPGTLFHVPAWTPHAVRCRERSLAVTLTWTRARPGGRAANPRRVAASLTRWDVASGYAEPIPTAVPGVLWTQRPLAAGPARRGGAALWVGGAEGPPVPAAARRGLPALTTMPWLPASLVARAGLEPLRAAGFLAPYDLPRRIRPDAPAALDGWRFA